MAVDTPARIAIVGAGPIGLEAALYARYLGYEVAIFERDELCASFRRQPPEKFREPAGRCRTPLGLAAIVAQDETHVPAPANQQQTAEELVASYFEPLANTDLLSDSLHLHHRVLQIERMPLPTEDDAEDRADADDTLDDEDAAAADESDEEDEELEEELDSAEHPPAPPLRVSGVRADGTEFSWTAEIVIDASGSADLPQHASSPAAGSPLTAWETLNVPLSAETLRPLPLEDSAELDHSPAIMTRERNFYLLGSRSFGLEPGFTFAIGHEQIRALFAIVGGRASLNLYATFGRK